MLFVSLDRASGNPAHLMTDPKSWMQAAAGRMQVGAVFRAQGDQAPHLTDRNAEMIGDLLR